MLFYIFEKLYPSLQIGFFEENATDIQNNLRIIFSYPFLKVFLVFYDLWNIYELFNFF